MGGEDKGEVGECAEPGAPDPRGTTICGKRYIRHQLNHRRANVRNLRQCDVEFVALVVRVVTQAAMVVGVQQFPLQVNGRPRPEFRHRIEVRHCQAGVPEDLH